MKPEEAIEILYSDKATYQELEEAINIAVKALKEQRQHGEWKLRSPYEAWFEEYKCSNCNAYGWFNWHFCPNCGADMRKEGEKNEIH